MKSLSIFGTSSDAGKSTIAFALTYLLAKRGRKVTPFKAQNVSNNSCITDDGGEIAVPQYFAATAINIPTTYLQNPILLKSAREKKAHLIVNGKSVGEKNVWGYYKDIDKLKPIVKEAFEKLQEKYECVIAEGAGSPVELNLMQKDLANIYIASKFNTKIILVADIERGGVFASIYGVYNLLPKELQKNVIGVIINKFRGDLSLFDSGVEIIQNEFGIKVLGVIPYKPFNMAFEDSASLFRYEQNKPNKKITVGIIAFAYMSNYNEFEPLIADSEVEVIFIHSPKQLKLCDLVILPGSKRVIEDLRWLEEKGFKKKLLKFKKKIIGICGGYEMMYETILDPYGIESEEKTFHGLGFFRGNVVFEKVKITQKGWYNCLGVMVYGYEIHNARTKKRSKKKKNVYGTFIHGIFENDAFRYKIFSAIDETYKGYNFLEYKKKKIESYTSFIANHIDMDYIDEQLHTK